MPACAILRGTDVAIDLERLQAQLDLISASNLPDVTKAVMKGLVQNLIAHELAHPFGVDDDPEMPANATAKEAKKLTSERRKSLMSTWNTQNPSAEYSDTAKAQLHQFIMSRSTVPN